jgi:hypothetical protein
MMKHREKRTGWPEHTTLEGDGWERAFVSSALGNLAVVEMRESLFAAKLASSFFRWLWVRRQCCRQQGESWAAAGTAAASALLEKFLKICSVLMQGQQVDVSGEFTDNMRGKSGDETAAGVDNDGWWDRVTHGACVNQCDKMPPEM